jgi:hypothetical protein
MNAFLNEFESRKSDHAERIGNDSFESALVVGWEDMQEFKGGIIQ